MDSVREAGSEELVLGIRPEDVEVDESGTAPPGQSISVTVDIVETVGSDNFIYTEVGDQEFRVRTSSFIEPDVGSEMTLTFDTPDLHLFDYYSEDAVFHGTRAAQMTPDVMDSPETSEAQMN